MYRRKQSPRCLCLCRLRDAFILSFQLLLTDTYDSRLRFVETKCIKLFTLFWNAYYFYSFRYYLIVVHSIPVYACLHSLVLIDQSSPVYASAIASGKHFLFFREPVKKPGGLKTWLTFALGMFSKENEGRFYTSESCTSLLLKQIVQQGWFAVAWFENQSMDRRANYGKGRGRGRGRSGYANTNTGIDIIIKAD